MRAQFVNEKFTDDSDAIRDMGIGIYSPQYFNSNQELYAFLYDIIPTLCHVDQPIDVISKYSKLYFKGNTLKELKAYMNKYVTMKDNLHNENSRNMSWWFFNAPAFYTYVKIRAGKESKINKTK